MTRLTRLGVFALILDDARRLLLVHQAAGGRWSLPGGGVRFGESPEQALRRELQEETGLEVVASRLVGTHDNVYDPGDGIQRHGVRLLYRVTAHDHAAVAGEEIDALDWFPLDGLPAAATAWAVAGAQLVDDLA